MLTFWARILLLAHRVGSAGKATVQLSAAKLTNSSLCLGLADRNLRSGVKTRPNG